jgi:murein L,D-transpeptidase YcbB/YkuD
MDRRIGQLRRALEYWRWLPRDLGARHVRVNIADFRLGAFEQGREVLARRAVLGTVRNRTPVFSDRIAALVLNPSWHVPAAIAAREILPELRKDPFYLARHGMEVLSGEAEGAAVPPDSVDWGAVDPEAFPYRLRQRPGPANPLGRIKFVLTNALQIYLHDTPAPHLFDRSRRDFSHGCVRVERPLELAAWVLGNPRWTADSLAREIGKGAERRIPVGAGGVRVHILYWTAFVDAAGILNFRGDVYGWDRLLERLLDGDGPGAGRRP